MLRLNLHNAEKWPCQWDLVIFFYYASIILNSIILMSSAHLQNSPWEGLHSQPVWACLLKDIIMVQQRLVGILMIIIIVIPCISNVTGAVNWGDDPSINDAIHSTVVPLYTRRVAIDNIVTSFGVVVETFCKLATFSSVPFTLQPIEIASGCWHWKVAVPWPQPQSEERNLSQKQLYSRPCMSIFFPIKLIIKINMHWVGIFLSKWVVPDK